MKIKLLNWVLIIDTISILLIMAIIFIPSSVVRVILGLPFLLFFPGYTLVSALFVKKEGINTIEWAALSFGMSIAVVALIGLGLNYTPLGVKLEPVLYFVTAFILVTSGIALLRRVRILKTLQLTSDVTLRMPRWGDGTFNKSLSLILIIVIFGAIGVLAFTLITPKVGEEYAEFYMLGVNGQAQDYPTDYIMNNGHITQVIYGKGTVDSISGTGAVTLGIVNHEQQSVDYSLKMTINDKPVKINFGGVASDELGPITLQQGQKWENAINIVPQFIQDNQKVEFLLYKGTYITPLNTLRLWINVKSGQ